MQSEAALAAGTAAGMRVEPNPERARASVLSLLAYGIVLTLTAWPILQVRNPMLTDYPNHLARIFVAQELANSDALGRYYFVRNVFYPYLPMDLIVGALSPLLGLELAGKIFIILSLMMPIVGVLAVSRVLHGRIGLWPLVSALFAYNLLLAWGFTTYLFSLGFALVAFAGWVATHSWAWRQRLPLFAAISSAIFCSHPFAFGAFALLVGAWEFGHTETWSLSNLRRTAIRLCLIGLQFTPALFIVSQLPRADIGGDATEYGSLTSRALALLSPGFFIVQPAEVGVFCSLLLIFAAALYTGILSFDRRMAWPVWVIAITSVLAPEALSGISLVHMRLPLLVILLLVASCSPRPQSKRLAALATMTVAAFLIIRTVIAADRLAEADREVSEMRAAASAIEEGARVLPAITLKRTGSLRPYHYWHAAAYLTIDRSAFYPLLFSFFNVDVVPSLKPFSVPAEAPVLFEVLSTPPSASKSAASLPGHLEYWHNWRQTFDYVIVFDFGEPETVIPKELSFVRRGAAFAIYKITK